MRILFVDAVCYKPYDQHTLDSEPLGGTEASVVRIAEGLAKRGHTVRVTQHNRTEQSTCGATYTPFKANDDFKASHVVVLRAPLMLHTARKQYPNAKLYLWCHDLFGAKGWGENGFQALVDTQAIPILVSDFHKLNMYDTLRSVNFQGQIPAKRIYNPIADDLRPDSTEVDANKLLFFSSPHKGLEYTLKVFSYFKNVAELANMRLHVANPGYFEDAKLDTSQSIVNLGPMKHSDVVNQLRSAFAVLHLNNVYPETFGLVYAEANAVGTPFIAHPIGALAMDGLVDHPQETVDVSNEKAVIEKLVGWVKVGRPKVRGNANYRLTKILREWEELLSLG